MANLGNFNAEEYKDEYAPIPAGSYPAIITASEEKTSRAGDVYIKLTVQIIDGQYRGRMVFTNLNLNNQSEKARSIAKTELANICRAVNVLHPRDTAELHNKPLIVKLSVDPETDQYPAQNRIKGWKSIGDTPKADEPIPMTLGAPVANKKPWEN